MLLREFFPIHEATPGVDDNIGAQEAERLFPGSVPRLRKLLSHMQSDDDVSYDRWEAENVLIVHDWENETTYEWNPQTKQWREST